MARWELTAYDTEMREDRSREYTTSKRTAELWDKIPRIQFSDSGHGVVFRVREMAAGERAKRVIPRMMHAHRELRRLRDEAKPARARKLNPPLLTEGPLSGDVFIVTIGRQLPDGIVESTTKYVITDQFEALAERRGWTRP